MPIPNVAHKRSELPVTIPATSKRTPARRAQKNTGVHKRATRSRTATAVAKVQESGASLVHRPSSQSEQLVILVGALAFGLLGLAIHFLWIVSILLMALLLGLIASEIGGRHGRGIVAEMVNEVKVVVDEIKTPGSRTDDDDLNPNSSQSPY